MTFQEAAIESSDIYYDYLDTHNGSLIEYTVTKSIQIDKFWYLELAQNIKSLEYLQIKINADIFNEEEIKPISFDSERKTLKVAPKRYINEYLINAKTENIKVVVDLKFLVKNVRSFYKKYYYRIKTPEYINNLSYITHPLLKEKLSDEQLNAVNTALSTPLSYVWGAPGTGKTRFVLSHCVLTYLQSFNNPKILIVAPTNNAVENTLYGVLPVLNKCGYNYDDVFRIGASSIEFSLKYPMCCEHSDIDKKAEELYNRIKETENNIGDIKKQLSIYPEYLKSKKFEADLLYCENTVYIKLKELYPFFDKYKEISNKIHLNEITIRITNSKTKELKKQINILTDQIKKLDLKYKKYSNGLYKVIFKRKCKFFEIEIEHKLKELTEIDNQIKFNSDEILKSNAYIEKQKLNLSDTENQINQIVNKIIELTSFWDKLQTKVSDITIDKDIRLFESEIAKQIEKGKSDLLKRSEKYKCIVDKTEEELKSELDYLENILSQLNLEYNNILSITSSFRMANCKILAATVDTCLRRVDVAGDFIPTHIFLDEAGYCSLIKGAALLAYNCPVTLLGDHMQLPPICEMNDEKFSGTNSVVALWAQSAIFIEDIYLEPYEIVNRYLNHKKPIFNELCKIDLNRTYRFGKELADILANYVYTNEFCSAISKGTDIYFINSSKIEAAKPRISSTELDNIIKYLSLHSDEDIGIITPYKVQRENIIKSLKNYDTDLKKFINRVYTVHGSQGKEFDTLLFSIVDTTNKWFTNSLLDISNGKCVVNTAVSRAKSKLILICDANYWKTQCNQLIGQLIEIATEIILL